MSHRCPARPCTIRVSDEKLACGKHWYKLPAMLRSKIWATKSLPITDPKRSEIIQEALAVWEADRQADRIRRGLH